MASAVAPSGERRAPPPAAAPQLPPAYPPGACRRSRADGDSNGKRRGLPSGIVSSPPPPRLVAGDLDLETGAPAPGLPPPALSRAALGSGLFATAPPEPGPPPRRRQSWRSRSSICMKLALFVSILVLVTSGTLAFTVWKYAHDDLESDIRLRLDTVATFKQQQASQHSRAEQDATFSCVLALVPRYLGAEGWASDLLTRYSDLEGPITDAATLASLEQAQIEALRLEAWYLLVSRLGRGPCDTDLSPCLVSLLMQKYLVSSLSIVQEFLSLAVYNKEGLLLMKVRQNATGEACCNIHLAGVHDPPGKVPPLPLAAPEHRTPAQSTLSTSICVEPPYFHKDELRLNMTIAILDLVTEDPVGCMHVVINATQLQGIVHAATGLQKTGEILLGFSLDNKTINYVVTPEKHPAFTHQPFSGPLALAIGGKSGFTRNRDTWNVAVAASYIPVGFLGWGLVAQINESEAYRLVHALTVVIIVAMCAILFVGLVATHFLAKRWAVSCACVSTVDEGSERLEDAVADGERFHLVIVDLWIGSDYPRGQGKADYKKSEVANLLANLRQKPQLLEVWAKEGVEAGQPEGGEPEAGMQLTEQVVEASQYASSLETPRLGRTSSRHGWQCSNCNPGQCEHYVLDSPIEERGSGSAHATSSTSPHGVHYERNDFCIRSPDCHSQAGLGEAAHGVGTAQATTASGAPIPGTEHRLESCRLPVVLLTSCGHKDIARCSELDVDTHVGKPIKRNVLFKAMQKALQLRAVLDLSPQNSGGILESHGDNDFHCYSNFHLEATAL
eukprot:SM000216S06556  [mRNA]  locus=s216:11122:17424:- [translate_table: standard]